MNLVTEQKQTHRFMVKFMVNKGGSVGVGWGGVGGGGGGGRRDELGVWD